MVSTLNLLVAAHDPINPSHTALKRRSENLDLQRRISEKCGPQLSRRHPARLSRRAARAGISFGDLHKNANLAPGQSTTNSTEGTCILTPENVSEGQAGIPLTVEVDFIDIETCEAVPNVWVDAWYCNSTGYYSGYVSMTGSNLSGGGGDPAVQMSMSMSITDFPTASATATANASTATQNAYSGADLVEAASMLNNEPADQESFLRGTRQANSDGQWRMYLVFPGWYPGRLIHFHVKVVEEVVAMEPYNTNTVTRLANDEDMWFAYENAEGYDAVMDVVYAGTNIIGGLVGSIIVALNTSYTSPEVSTQRWAGDNSTTAVVETATATSASETSTATESAEAAEVTDDGCEEYNFLAMAWTR
ncbi:dioxygenase [Ceratobasidium sp. AG-Ba]|nr:dioxygenase [Ceratobasidium sp. AG-Ba]